MARPERNTVDYFPFICEEGKKMYYIEQKYGNDGFATFIKILRELAKTEYHYLNLNEDTTMMFLSSKCLVNIELLNEIINDLVILGKFDKELWEQNKVIWCQGFIESIEDAYKKRVNNCMDKNGLLLLLGSKSSRNKVKVSVNELKVVNYPQRIEEDRIEEKRKEDIKSSAAINFSEFHKYFNENCGEIAKIQKLTTNRKRAVNSILVKFGKTKIFQVVKYLTLSDFLQNKTKRSEEHKNFRVDFDWIFKEQNFTKIIEGKYHDKIEEPTPTKVLLNNENDNPYGEIKQEMVSINYKDLLI